jgi:radical SAM protein with 4Fe4S-binding SPASM domain
MRYRNLAKAVLQEPLYFIDRVMPHVPVAKGLFTNNFATYKFLTAKLQHRLGVLCPSTFVQWLATYDCNFSCAHCEAGAGSTKVEELSTAQAFKMVDEMAELKTRRLFITGGEPLVRKDLFEVIEHTIEKGIAYGIGSNGYLVDRFHDQFRRLKPYVFFTSIDGLEKQNDEVRGVDGAYRGTMEALEFFRSIDVPLRMVNTVVHPGNLDQLPELGKKIRDSAASFWRIALAIPVGRAQENGGFYLDNEQTAQVFEFIAKTKKIMPIGLSEDAGYLGCSGMKVRSHPFFCGAGLTRCSIMPDGEVLGCQIAYDNKYSEGNVKDVSLVEIWRERFLSFRNPTFPDECVDCSHFNACRGGCWGMRLGNRHCYKEIWDR